ncbi:MAG: putative DNA binding domain-containing protein [Planctomycetaceae bacterium]|jgi:ATP-dependent DNA helicase RecG|nr:putative DNA binding domain-containing protein [Planctomycetaceae bacterium]
MEIIELVSIISRGEDSEHQFKKNITNIESLTSEMVAFSNGQGGTLLIGVDDNGLITGLSDDDVRRLNQMISNVASQRVHPAVNPTTQNIITDGGLILVLSVPSGNNKPYQDNSGIFWVKCGADKRRVSSREEIRRLFQESGLLQADESPVRNATLADLDIGYFSKFFERRYHKTLQQNGLSLEQTIYNMNLGKNEMLNLTGVLLFAKNPSDILPAFIVKSGAFSSNTLVTDNYNDSRDIKGKLADIFGQTINFIVSNLHQVQNKQSVNSLGEPEIPIMALEEIVANALIHRDYFVSAPIRVFVFANRVEVISPGHLPNNLTVNNIKAGISNTRNPVLASLANQILPYRGYGSGILRVLSVCPDILFEDDRNGNLFKVTFLRKQ